MAFSTFWDMHMRTIHWIAPVTIILAAISGALFALGHHVFYHSLDGKVVPMGRYIVLGSEITEQQLNLSIGTAFAFLVKTSLTTAVSMAYVQILWRLFVLPASYRRTLRDLDVMFSGISSIYSLLEIQIWWRNPLLYLLALLAWLLPIAAIITPGTLSINTGQEIKKSIEQVPNVQWVSYNYVNDMPSTLTPGDMALSDGFDTWSYNGPSEPVQAIVNEVLTTGSIVTISPQRINSSWALDFAGPALRCGNVSDSSRSSILGNIKDAILQKDSCQAYAYIAWTSGLPFVKNGNASNTSYAISSASLFDSIPMSFRLVGIPETMTTPENSEPQACSILDFRQINSYLEKATILECEVFNSTYSASFNFVEGQQTIDVHTTLLSDHPVISTTAFNKSTIGDCQPLNGWTPVIEDEPDSRWYCGFDPVLISALSYQGIMDAFTHVLAGSIYYTYSNLSQSVSSAVTGTVLMQTPELRFLDNLGSTVSLKETMRSWALMDGLVTVPAQKPVGRLLETLEKLFENTVISMMSSRSLRPNLASAYAPRPVEVTYLTLQTIYSYSAMKLWAAYSLAILLTVLAAVAGLLAIVANGASYSDQFSSVFRIGRGTEVEVKKVDADGKDPLPLYLSKEKVGWTRPASYQNSKEDEYEMEQSVKADATAHTLNQVRKSGSQPLLTSTELKTSQTL